jgi:adenylate cyclase
MNEISGGAGPTEQPRRWSTFWDRGLSLAVLPGDRPDLIRTKRLFTGAIWASLLTSGVSTYQYLLFDAPWAALAVVSPIVTAAIALFLMWRRPRAFPGVMHVVAVGTLITTISIIILFGGIYESAGNSSWAMLTVVGAAAIFADRRAHYWLAAFVAALIGASLVADRVEPLYVLPSRGYFALFNLLVVMVFIYAVLYYFVRQSARLYTESEKLLRNILPDEVADRLKRSDQMIADEFSAASILFADVAGFTPMSAEMTPGHVIDLLNQVFTDFDRLVDERGLEKIKTIGDAYMVASGVPVPRDDHAKALCDLALAMQEHLEERTYGGRQLGMRIGIASGPVMAGIIGLKKFSYDLWGDTVNLASRMESTGTPGRIQLPAATCDLVASWFTCERRGVIDVKGKGQLETWYLIGRKSS